MTARVDQAGIPWLRRGWITPEVVTKPPATKPPATWIPYEIPVRRGAIGRFILPSDLTTTEGERLCGIIRAIAFPGTAA